MHYKHDLAEGERDILDQGKNNSMGNSLLTAPFAHPLSNV